MMEFLDTPNPNAKKIITNHGFEISKNISVDEAEAIPEVKILLEVNGIQNIFTGPDFITVIKDSSAIWEDIFQEFKNKLDNI